MSASRLVKKPLLAAAAQLKRTGRALGKLKPAPVHPAQALHDIKARRAARRRPSGLQLALADRVDFLNPAHWDELATQSIFLSRDYLRVLEAHAPDNLEPRYALAYDDGRPAWRPHRLHSMIQQAINLLTRIPTLHAIVVMQRSNSAPRRSIRQNTV